MTPERANEIAEEIASQHVKFGGSLKSLTAAIAEALIEASKVKVTARERPPFKFDDI